MAFSIDGSVHSANYSSGTSISVTGLTTTNSNDIIVCVVQISGSNGSPTSISTSGVVWQSSARKQVQFFGAGNTIEFWYGVAASPLSNVTTTVNLPAPSSSTCALVFAVSGADTKAIFDANASLPASVANGTSAAPSVSGVSTTTANDFIICVCADYPIVTETAGSGFTLLTSYNNANNIGTAIQYQTASGTLSSATTAFGTSASNYGIITDALPPGLGAQLAGAGALTATTRQLLAASAALNGAAALSASAALLPGAFGVDGAVATAAYSSGTSISVPGLTTAYLNDIIVAVYQCQASAVVSVSSISTPGVTWNTSARKQLVYYGGTASFEVWYGTAASPLSNVTTTINLNGTPNSTTQAMVFAIKNGNINNISDSNASLPGSATGASTVPSVNISTTTPNDCALVCTVNYTNVTQTPGSGYTLIANYTVVNVSISAEFQAVSGTLSSAAAAFGLNGNNWGLIADALVPKPNVWSGAGLLAGSGSFVSLAQLLETAGSAFAGAGALVVNVSPMYALKATLAGAGGIGASANLLQASAALLAGAGSLTATVSYQTQALTTVLAGAGTLTASASPMLGTAATLPGSGVLLATAATLMPSSALLSGAGLLSAAAAQLLVTTARFGGAGGLAADSTIPDALAGGGKVALAMLPSGAFVNFGAVTAGIQTGAPVAPWPPQLILPITLAGAGSLIADAVGQAANVWTGQALLVGAGTLAASVTILQPSAAVFAGTGSLTVTASPILMATAASLAGAGSLTAVAAQQLVTTAGLAGAGSLTATAAATDTAAALLAGASALAASAIMIAHTAAAFAGAGGVTAAAVQTQTALATLAGAGALAAQAATVIFDTPPALVGAGALTATATAALLAAALLAGTGSLTATAAALMPSAALLAGTGALSSAAAIVMPAAAALSGQSALTATARQLLATTAVFAGSGTLVVAETVRSLVAAQFAGTGTLAVNEVMLLPIVPGLLTGTGMLAVDSNIVHAGQIALAANLVGAGALIASTTQFMAAPALLAGSGGLTANINPQTRLAAAALAGAGALAVNETQQQVASATLSGAGSLTVSFGGATPIAATLTGAGTLIANAIRLTALTPQPLAGSGTMSAVAALALASGASLSGAGALTASTRSLLAAYISLGGSGVLTALAGQVMAAAATYLGAGNLAALANALLHTSVTLVGTGTIVVDAELTLSVVKGYVTIGDQYAFHVAAGDQLATQLGSIAAGDQQAFSVRAGDQPAGNKGSVAGGDQRAFKVVVSDQ